MEENSEQLSILRHSSSHVLAQAVKELFPEAKLGIGPAIADGFYYDFAVKTPFTEDDLKLIENRMREIAGKDLPFIKKIGKEIPEKIVILPMIVENKVVGLLYGDTLPGTLPCKSVDAIMILLNLASLSLEISHLKKVVTQVGAA